MLKRKIDGDLADWKNSPRKTALLLKGARQVGKTTSVRAFGASHYGNFIEINFEKFPRFKRAFEGNLDADTVIRALSLMGLGPFIPHSTLIFFDEIQSCPNARTAVKFLVEDGKYDYIESGSLLGINYKEVPSFPVGSERQLEMHPLDFEEFLWAKNVGDDVISFARRCCTDAKPLDSFTHGLLMRYFREFMLVGGMPGVVTAYVRNPDFAETLAEQRLITGSYRDDIAKYCESQSEREVAKAVFDAIPEQLAKPNKRFFLSELEKGATHRRYGEPTAKLADAGVCHKCRCLSSLELPFSLHRKENMYKLYSLDTGLLCSFEKKSVQADVLFGDISVNEGGIAENAVAAELVKRGHALYYYDRKSRMELDFIIKDGNGISVIEVKSGKDYKAHASLTNAVTESPALFKRKLVLSRENISAGANGIIYMPLYAAMFL